MKTLPATFDLKVYTYFDATEQRPEPAARIIRLWERSWRARGWEPRILTPRTAQDIFDFKDELEALLRFGPCRLERVGLLVAFNVVNFGLKPKGVGKIINCSEWLADGWKTAALVRFTDFPIYENILDCGRAI